MEELGYTRFAAHGADWGALISADLGHRYPARVMGVHFTMMLRWTVQAPRRAPETMTTTRRP